MKKNYSHQRSRFATCMFIAMMGISQIAVAEESALPEADAPYTFLDSVKDGKALTNFLLRYETVEQDGFSNGTAKFDDANGLFLRSLVGWQTAPYNSLSFTAQITDVHQFTDNHNDRRGNVSESGNGNFANIVDPSFTDINQLFVDWTAIRNTRVRLGRQVVNLDNVRFIGDIAFRLNTQVFDGISVLNKSIPNTEIFASHFAQVRQINTALRQGGIDLLNVKHYISPSETLVGYGYFIDVENLSQNGGNPLAAPTAAQGGNGLGGSQDVNSAFTTDQSNKTIGIRLDGVRAINPEWKGVYTAEFAKQSDYAGGNPEIDAYYYKLGGGASYAGWTVRVDREKLSSNDGRYGFQTPLGTNHLFQGWADVFLATPRQGLEDTFLTITGTYEKVSVYAAFHMFKSDENFQSVGKLSDDYGSEFNFRLAYPVNKNLVTKFEYANYSEKDVYGTLTGAARRADRQITWLTAQYTF